MVTSSQSRFEPRLIIVRFVISSLTDRFSTDYILCTCLNLFPLDSEIIQTHDDEIKLQQELKQRIIIVGRQSVILFQFHYTVR